LCVGAERVAPVVVVGGVFSKITTPPVGVIFSDAFVTGASEPLPLSVAIGSVAFGPTSIREADALGMELLTQQLKTLDIVTTYKLKRLTP
jgi:hypothetical protein